MLDRSRPDVHVAQLVVLAVPGEYVGLSPRLDDQVVRLLVALAQRRRVHTDGVVAIHRGADGETGDQAAAGDDIDHRHLLGDARRRVVVRDRLPEEEDRRVGRASRQRGRHQLRGRHHAVGVLVVLVHAHAVEAELGGELELVEVVVVDLVTTHWVVEPRIHVDPDAAVLLSEVVGQIRPGHQVEPVEFHATSLRRRAPGTDARLRAEDTRPPRGRPSASPDDRPGRGAGRGGYSRTGQNLVATSHASAVAIAPKARSAM